MGRCRSPADFAARRPHGHRAAFERDHRRDADLAASGSLVLRFTWRQIRDRPLWVASRLAQTLAQRRVLLGVG